MPKRSVFLVGWAHFSVDMCALSTSLMMVIVLDLVSDFVTNIDHMDTNLIVDFI